MSSLVRRVSPFLFVASAHAYSFGAVPTRAVQRRAGEVLLSDTEFDGVKPSTVFSTLQPSH